jgi:hypothetical protein
LGGARLGSCFQSRDVTLDLFVVFNADWAVAGELAKVPHGLFRAPEHALPKLRVIQDVAEAGHRPLPLEPDQAGVDVRGIGDPAHLAVTEHIHAHLGLLVNNVGHRRLNCAVERALVSRTVFFREELWQELGRPWQAAGVGGENAVSTLLDGSNLTLSRQRDPWRQFPGAAGQRL